MNLRSFGSAKGGKAASDPNERLAWAGLILLVSVTSLVLVAFVFVSAERDAAFRDQVIVHENTEQVRHYDELLTNSARLAASTGDIELIRRYEALVPELDAALNALTRVTDDESARRAITTMSEVNQALVAMEVRALRLTRQGRGPEAEALLTSPRYEREKAAYAVGLEQVVDLLRAAGDDRVDRADTYRFLVVALGLWGAMTVLTLGFLYARRNRDTRRQLSARDRELAHHLGVFRALTDNTTDALYVKDLEGRYQMMNPAGAAMFGSRPPEEIIGRTDTELMGTEWGEAIRELDRRTAEAEGPREEVETLTLGGEERTFVSSRGRLRDPDGFPRGVFGISRDITDQHRRFTFMGVQHEVSKVLVENPEPGRVAELVLPKLVEAPDILWAAHWASLEDEEEHICTTVSAGEGVEPPFARGDRRRFDLEGDEEAFETVWLDNGKDCSEAVVLLPPDGIVLLACSPAVSGNQDLEMAIGVVAMQVSNYLERSRLVRETERVKDEFFGLISHELRTPLTSIIGYAELLAEIEDERLGEQGKRFVEVIERNARRELRLVQDMLLLVQLGGGRFRLEREEVELAEIVRGSCEALRPQADAKGMRLELEIADVGRAWVDPHRIGQVVDNLLTNAIKFSSGGSTISVVLRPAGGSAEIEVADQGIGVPAEEVDRLFDRMFRASSATGRQIVGTGLGLTIVKAVAEAHGGSVAVSSVESEGTTFTIELPLERQPPK